ncbi:helix-turn-helix transcriptional regulator [Amaricoccus sp.]|uniref:helix-turn-helix transcriptional regulator n=1 Tax=Amaricoccus sp. TaxID=1872485 RepID=UPI001B401E92|nr:helix-turn-helix transcriptional regulator [Amaricoccus sp.]MBP7241982.1 helix-turn-helix transcriptional regulator [Amaricoccus sp.]
MNQPVSAAAFSDFVGAIYDCALDPSRWPEVLAALGAEMQFRMSSLILVVAPQGGTLDAGVRALLDITTGITAEQRRAMLDTGQASVEAWGPPGTLARLPLETPLVRSEINPDAAGSRFVREQCLPLGFFDNLSILLSRERTSFSVVSFNRHVDDGPIREAEVELARLLVPHLRRALVVSQLLEARLVERAAYHAVLDTLSVAVLLVGPDLGLVHANRAGETLLRTGDPLGVRHGRVSAPGGLAAALAVAVAAEREHIGRRGLGVPARRADGEALVLHVLPLGAASRMGGAAAAIFVAPAAAPPPPPLAAVAALFDLTPAEARVLEAVGAGRTPEEAAAALGIARSTLHTHLLRLFDKTGTHRQADLVALLASFTLPIG